MPDSDSFRPLILFATETGTSEDAANKIARECRRIYLSCRVYNIEDYPLSDILSEDIIIFLVSTTGSGVSPRSMNSFWDMLLRSDLPVDLFSDIYFAIFGLGDTSYEKFCWPSKKLFRRLESLGAQSLLERGEGDEQHPAGIDGTLEPWIERLLKQLTDINPKLLAEIPPTTLSISRVSLSEIQSPESSSSPPNPFIENDSFHTATLQVNKRITAEDWYQEVRHFEFQFDDNIEYSPGDCAVIRPEPRFDQVEAFLNMMGWANSADHLMSIKRNVTDQTFPADLPPALTLRQIFTHHLDFNAIPRRTFFQFLQYFVADEMEHDKLGEFLSADGAEELYEYCFQVHRTIFEVLTEFRSAKIPLNYIFDVFPPLRPREFSIASSGKTHPRQVHLCVAIVKYRTKLKVPREGLCSNFLASLQPGQHLPIKIRKGLLQLPSLDKPIICVGPGTGIAPMRATIQERIHLGSSKNTLYIGCRSQHKDYHYGSEWSNYTEHNNQQLVLRTAFSRDGPEGDKRTYVQDLIRQDGVRIWNLVHIEGGSVFISGSSNKMPEGVKQALRDVAIEQGEMSESEARKYVSKLEKEQRLIEECWS